MAKWLGDWRGMFRPAPNPTPWRAALCLLCCVLAGYAGHRLHVPLAWVLAGPVGLGAHGIVIAVAIAFSTLAVVSVIVFRRGRWKTKQV